MTSDFEELRIACGIDADRWEVQRQHHEILQHIYHDHSSRMVKLKSLASSLSAMLQQVEGVHSVRWRIKSPEHLIEKICRKKEGSVLKYEDLTIDNYRSRITDLIGIRVLHLTKDEFEPLHHSIMDTWDLVDGEEPIAYVRSGDHDELKARYEQLGLTVKDHDDGYRSIHYIIKTSFTKEPISCELQVRTLFEEGWSEIDHVVRYPTFTNEALVKDFLDIFNRLSGAADEMGTFVRKLSSAMTHMKSDTLQLEKQAAQQRAEFEEKIEKMKLTHAKENEGLRRELEEIRRMGEVVSKPITSGMISSEGYLERAYRDAHDSLKLTSERRKIIEADLLSYQASRLRSEELIKSALHGGNSHKKKPRNE